MENLVPFKREFRSVDVWLVLDDADEVWIDSFAIARVLGVQPAQVLGCLDSLEKMVVRKGDLGRKFDTTLVSESGWARIRTKAKNPLCKEMDAWLRDEVRPTLRRPAPPAAAASAVVPKVFAREGKVFTSSRDVAAMFGKEHKHVLRDIRELIAREPSIGSKFGPFKIKDLTGESTSHYNMDRDGFTLLAMGFTTANALKFKLAYIAEFNRMEETLRAAPPAPAARPMTREQIMAQALLLADETMKEQAAQIEVLAPKAAVEFFAGRFLCTTGMAGASIALTA